MTAVTPETRKADHKSSVFVCYRREDTQDAAGRLDIEDDLVRTEIRAALQQKIPVIPVTVQNAGMPQAEDLPEDIRPWPAGTASS